MPADGASDGAVDLEALDRRMVGPGSPFQLDTIATLHGPRRRFRAGPATLFELIEGLGRRGDRPFIVADADRLSYSLFLDRAKAAAAALRRRGLRSGDRIVLALPTGLDWLIAFAGSLLCGGIVVMAPPGILETDAECDAAGCVLAVRDPNQWKGWLADAEDGPVLSDHSRSTPEAEALVAFTSGTSGVPKPVRLDHRSVMSGLRNMMLGAALAGSRKPRIPTASPSASPCVLLLAPLHHVAGYSQFLLMAMLGGRLVIPSRWRPSTIAQEIERDGVRSLQGLLPEMAYDLLEADPNRLDGLTAVNFYGAPPPTATIERLKAAFPHLEMGSGYGLTETGGSIAVASEYDLAQRPGTTGRVSPAVEIRIRGEDGSDCGSGEVGEIWLAGPMLAKGYGLSNQSNTAFEGGWFKTGDLGRMDADRFLYLLDRKEDVIESGGRWRSCQAMEQAAQRQPGVRDAAAFAAPDQALGKRPCLAVVSDRMFANCRLRRAVARSVDVPEQDVFMIDTIPRGPSGKIDRRALVSRLDRLYASSSA
jgi:acyl-CoA synthetase (AMP-forming)/AMP-acid ligase II